MHRASESCLGKLRRFFLPSFPVSLVLMPVLASCIGVAPPESLDGYEVERLPALITASYAQGSDVYLGLEDGRIMLVDDRDLTRPWENLGNPLRGGPRLLFASRDGTLFASADDRQLWRAAAPGDPWETCLDVPVWRMDEDDAGNLYAGNYQKDDAHHATLYKSTDGGQTWDVVYENAENHHIHTVRFDASERKLYIAFGDGASRGQAYSDDAGATWTTLAVGPREGHTDVTFTRDYVIWCSDDQSGRIERVRRADGTVRRELFLNQFMWFGVSDHEQVYVGTIIAHPLQRAVLLASADQGETWQTLQRTFPGAGAYGASFFAESRELSENGWLYYTVTETDGPASYRVRRRP